MPYVQYPHATLLVQGNQLQGLAARIEEAHRGAQDCAGLDSADHGPLVAAVESFRSGWNTSLQQLTANVATTGAQAIGIGRLVAEVDGQLAAGLMPGRAAAAR